MASMTRVAMVSTWANVQAEMVLTSMMQTMKSSLMSRITVMSRLATKSRVRMGMKRRKRLRRSLPLSVTRSVRAAMSAAVGRGKRVIIQPVRHSSGKAMAPMSAGIQNSLTPRSFMA